MAQGLGGFLQSLIQPSQQAQMPGGLGQADPMSGMGPLQRLQYMRQNNPEALMGLAAGMMQGNLGSGLAMAGDQMAAHREAFTKRQDALRKENMTKRWLMTNKGLSDEEATMAMSNPEILGTYLQSQKSNLTDDQREYEMARQQGFEGSFMDYQVKMKEAGRNQVNIDTGVKLPSGFRWIDPQKQELGVEPIPGGPGEQMPSELAARIGLAQDAIGKLDRVEQAAASGDLTGPVDWAMGQAGKGEPGELNRELAAGAEALTRMLTGAGMNIAEAQREANLYLPRPWDDAPTLANKVAQLKRRLQSTIEMAGRGRGIERPQSDGWQDVGGGVRIRRKN